MHATEQEPEFDPDTVPSLMLTGEEVGEEIMALVRANLANRIEAQRAVAREQQLKAAEFLQQMGGREACTVEGLGQLVLRITPQAYHYWGTRLGYECWQDPQFRHEFHRDNEAARVKYVPRKVTIRR